jgi:hypothetical protein
MTGNKKGGALIEGAICLALIAVGCYSYMKKHYKFYEKQNGFVFRFTHTIFRHQNPDIYASSESLKHLVIAEEEEIEAEMGRFNFEDEFSPEIEDENLSLAENNIM